MFYFKKKPKYLKMTEVAEILKIDVGKLYIWVEDLESYGVEKFYKTPLGIALIEEDQIKVLKEYSLIKEHFNLPSDATSILKNTNTFKREVEDFEWAKGLRHVIWRRH